MMDRRLYLGIDGGATKCRARLMDARGQVLGEGQAGPANTRLGLERAFEAVTTAAARALAEAGRDGAQLASVHAGAGLAGLIPGHDCLAATPHPFASLTVETDAYIACLGAHGGADGGIMVFGTGSCGCAILAGKTVTVGGWGFHLSDHGSGARVGLEALRHSLLAHDDVIAGSALSARVLARFDGSPEAAMLWAATAEPADYGRFARLVVELSEDGDELAGALMRRAGADASRLIRALRRRGAERIALVGGFSAPLRPWLADDVLATLVEPLGDALDGALVLARRAQGEGARAR